MFTKEQQLKGLKNRHEKTLKERQEKYYKECLNICNENNYILLTQSQEIVNNKTYIHYVCPKHGEKQMRIANFKLGKRCPDCNRENQSKKYRLSEDQIIKRIVECGGELFNPTDYINRHEKNLSISCPLCKTPFITSFVLFTQHNGQLCFECSDNISKGEKLIKLYLDEHNINYEQQKWWDECRDINPLPFDFYLPNSNKIIEFDGRQHFGETFYFSYTYEQTLRHDTIKNSYCEQNGIEIIRIPYWKENKINDILNEKLA